MVLRRDGRYRIVGGEGEYRLRYLDCEVEDCRYAGVHIWFLLVRSERREGGVKKGGCENYY